MEIIIIGSDPEPGLIAMELLKKQLADAVVVPPIAWGGIWTRPIFQPRNI